MSKEVTWELNQLSERRKWLALFCRGEDDFMRKEHTEEVEVEAAAFGRGRCWCWLGSAANGEDYGLGSFA